MQPSRAVGADGRRSGAAGEVFLVFLRLGLTSFGGPVAHLGYFREELVVRRRWLTDRGYADLVALCQFLPGPASSQVGMAVGLQRAGIRGLAAAWAGFTLPSAVLLVGFAYGVGALGEAAGTGWIQGLKAAAVAVVAHAVLGMARTLAPDVPRAAIAVAGAIAVLLVPHAFVQVAVIAAAGLAGLVWLRPPAATQGETDPPTVRVPRTVAVASLAAFTALLVALPVLATTTGSSAVRLVDVFYRAGSLVFGGGHVVLPLLQSELVPTGLVGNDEFLAGYGAAQAVPGPLFTFAAYLGALTTSPSGVIGASIALVAVFLPAALLIVAALPFWERLRHAPRARRALMGVNAGVVGLLAAALYDPVITQGLTSAAGLAVAVGAYVALTRWAAPPWAIVLGAGLIGLVAL